MILINGIIESKNLTHTHKIAVTNDDLFIGYETNNSFYSGLIDHVIIKNR